MASFVPPGDGGTVAPGFEAVREAFRANFDPSAQDAELGAALCVYHRGACVVDVWAGWLDSSESKAWTADSLVNVWSATKGIVALVVAACVEDGTIDLAMPVARYWPEFGSSGKSAITVDQLLTHRAGLPGFAAPTAYDDLLEWDRTCSRLAEQAPLLPPGDPPCYHAVTFGFLVGELVRRAGGIPVQHAVRALVAPLDADVYLGAAHRPERPVAEVIGPPKAEVAIDTSLPEPILLALANPPLDASVANRQSWRDAVIPAANGHASARGLARAYRTIAGMSDPVCNRDAPAFLRHPATTSPDMLLGIAPLWRAGLMGNPMGIYGPSPTTIGHCGWGGSFGCADPELGLTIGYVCNRMDESLLSSARARRLCEAVVASLC